MLGHYPAGGSGKQLAHLAQLWATQNMTLYDYGSDGNLARYGQLRAPLFNFENIEGIPIAFMIGLNDEYHTMQDALWLADQLGDNMVAFNTYPLGHMSWFVSRDMSYMQDVVELLRQYHPFVQSL